jgi:hypothetical protein
VGCAEYGAVKDLRLEIREVDVLQKTFVENVSQTTPRSLELLFASVYGTLLLCCLTALA